MNKLNLNASTVTDIIRTKGKITDCIRCKVNVEGVTIECTYDTIGQQVTVYRGYRLDRDTCDALINALPAYLATIPKD